MTGLDLRAHTDQFRDDFFVFVNEVLLIQHVFLDLSDVTIQLIDFFLEIQKNDRDHYDFNKYMD